MIINQIFKNKLISEAFTFTILRYLSYGIDAIKGIIIAKYLGPTVFGIWGFIILLMQYGSYLHLGSIYFGDRELPKLFQEDYQKANKLINNILSIYFINTVLLSIILLIVSFLINSDYLTPETCLILFILLIIEMIKFLSRTWIRSKKNLYTIGFSLLGYSVISLLLILLTLKYLELWGIVIARICGILVFLIIVKRDIFKISLKENFFQFFDNIKIIWKSIFLFLYNLSFVIKQTISRLLIASMLSSVMMGYYSFAYFIYQGIIISTDGIYSLVFPRIMEKYNQKKDLDVYKERLSSIGISLIFPLAILSSYLISAIIPRLMPQYINSIIPSVILLSGMAISSPAFGSGIILLAKYQERKLLYLNIISSVILFILIYILLKFKISLIGISIAESFVLFISSIITIYLVEKSSNNNKFRNKLLHFIPILISIGILLVPLIFREFYNLIDHIHILIVITQLLTILLTIISHIKYLLNN